MIDEALSPLGPMRPDRGATSRRDILSSVVTAAGVTGVGSEFDTVAKVDEPSDPQRSGRMSYRVTEADLDRHQCTVELTSRDGRGRYFESGSWTFRAVSAQGGTLLTCSVDFVLRIRWIVLAPIFYLMRGAITKDLRRLKAVLEAE